MESICQVPQSNNVELHIPQEEITPTALVQPHYMREVDSNDFLKSQYHLELYNQRLLSAQRARLRRYQLETPDQRKARLAAHALRAAIRRQNETPEQRNKRRAANRERQALRRRLLRLQNLALKEKTLQHLNLAGNLQDANFRGINPEYLTTNFPFPFEENHVNQSYPLEKGSSTEVEGRRFIDIKYFFDKLKTFHGGCALFNIEILREETDGLSSEISFRCNSCRINFALNLTDPTLDEMDVNRAAVDGSVSSGMGYSGLKVFLDKVGVPCMSENKYNSVIVENETKLAKNNSTKIIKEETVQREQIHIKEEITEDDHYMYVQCNYNV